ncbi:hypothetical protein PAXRUDRAFT_12016 [Paxillus rubicundulus Ve08.2h10]|uniref:Uncharacterized protein n=1 Tax=Paxillus rubicundulus Ve08.2h10 TaxID=930991 RepID=A0A0D0E212_9AGAM|nr:hypothetical protein PAXRUDRAFT_12016 [Paxillus rubicundulus Ve08.2h10]
MLYPKRPACADSRLDEELSVPPLILPPLPSKIHPQSASRAQTNKPNDDTLNERHPRLHHSNNKKSRKSHQHSPRPPSPTSSPRRHANTLSSEPPRGRAPMPDHQYESNALYDESPELS